MKKFCALVIRNKTVKTSYGHLFEDKERSDCFYASPKSSQDSSALYLYNDGENYSSIWNNMIQKVPKQYEYYGLISDKDSVKINTTNSFYNQILLDLDKFNPAIYSPSRNDF